SSQSSLSHSSYQILVASLINNSSDAKGYFFISAETHCCDPQQVNNSVAAISFCNLLKSDSVINYFIDAPCSIQQRIRSLSASVIFVLLFCGIVFVKTTRCMIRSFFFTISSGVSYITPFGAALYTSSVGFDEWQFIHLSWMIIFTSLNSIFELQAPGSFGGAEIKAPASKI